MQFSVNFIERKTADTASIEKVFRQVAPGLESSGVSTSFQKLPFGNGVIGILRNLLSFKAAKSDIYHVTGHVHFICLILPKARTILTVHDLGILHNRKGLRRYVLKKMLFDWPVKRLRYITTVSDATKRELIKYTNCPQGKITVIENPVGYSIAAKEKDFNSECPILLQVGTAPNKNLDNLIRAVKSIKCKLRILGRLNKNQKELLHKSGVEYENVFELSESEMRDEYVNADIVAFCSTFEGFGLPIIEGQALGTPVVTSDISPLKEVAGGGAILADPFDVDSIERSMLQVIEDPSIRVAIVNKGFENVARFLPDLIANKYLKLYSEILVNISKDNV